MHTPIPVESNSFFHSTSLHPYSSILRFLAYSHHCKLCLCMQTQFTLYHSYFSFSLILKLISSFLPGGKAETSSFAFNTHFDTYLQFAHCTSLTGSRFFHSPLPPLPKPILSLRTKITTTARFLCFLF